MARDWSKWRKVLSPAAVALHQEIEKRGEDETVPLAEIQATTNRSKTAVRNALAELHGHGLIVMTEEEPYDEEW